MRLYSRKVMGQAFQHNVPKRKIGAAAAAGTALMAAYTIAQSDDGFDEAFRALKRNENLQFEMPVPPPIDTAPPPDTPGWLRAIADFFTAIFSFLAPILPYIFYGLLALGVGTILYFILRDVIGLRLPEKPDTKPAEADVTPLYAPSTDEARILLGAVDALAAEGKYAEAVHTLLYRSIQDIDLKRPNQIRRSLTSREIGQLDILTPDARSAFSLIGRVVETSFFGGRALGQGDFQKCRDAYEQFAVPKAWAA